MTDDELELTGQRVSMPPFSCFDEELDTMPDVDFDAPAWEPGEWTMEVGQ